jgi:hypothetical protein
MMFDEPAQPTGEHGPELDRQCTGDVTAREVVEATNVDEQRVFGEQCADVVDIESLERWQPRIQAGTDAVHLG